MMDRKKWLGLMLLGLLLVGVKPACAQSEGLNLEHSPNGKRLLSLHEEKRADLQADYFKSIGNPVSRFVQACERHIQRYNASLDREMRNLTRQGKLDQAKAVQDAIKRTEGWTITPPNNEGLHFLSKASLEVSGSDEATKHGVDLQVNVEKAGVLYIKQTNTYFDQYKAKVQSARETLLDELAKVQEQEQRSGRLDAVQEVQAAIATIKELPEVEKPEPPANEPEGDSPSRPDQEFKPFDKITISDAMLGFYSIRYNGSDRQYREVLIELRKDRALVRGEYSYTRDRSLQWSQEDSAVEVTRRNDTGMAWRFKDSSDTEVIVNLQITERHERVYIPSDSTFTTGTGNGGFTELARCYVRKLGYTADTVKGFDDGVYHIELDLKRDPDGGEIEGKTKFRLEVTAGTFYINQRTSIADPDKFKPCMPTVFRVRAQGGDILWEAEYTLGRQQELFVQRTLKDGTKEMQLWWDRADYNNGQTADAYGTLTKEED